MVAIPFETVTELRHRVFDLRLSSADEAAEPYSVADLVDTVRTTRAAIRSTLQSLPDRAFERQPDDVDGNDVWSAGQIVSHLCEARVRFDHYGVLRELAGLDPSLPSNDWHEFIEGPRLLSRSQSLAALDLLESEFEALADALPAHVNLKQRVEVPPFGSMGFRGILMQGLLHENLHEEQLRELSAVSVH